MAQEVSHKLFFFFNLTLPLSLFQEKDDACDVWHCDVSSMAEGNKVGVH